MLRILTVTGLLSMMLAGTVDLAGCPFFPANAVTVELVNEADADVRVVLTHTDEEGLLFEDLIAVGVEIERTVDDGDTSVLRIPCDVAAAIAIEDAELEVIFGEGPNAETSVLVLGEDYECGDIVRFRFQDEDLGTELNIVVEVIPAL